MICIFLQKNRKKLKSEINVDENVKLIKFFMCDIIEFVKGNKNWR